jgi:hypothetical protein
MAKFLNKKEQVIDFKLTTYGKHVLSVGKLKPAFYAFFDDNILYDPSYARTRGTDHGVSGSARSQNSNHPRIKNETQYLEGLVLFEDVEKEARLVDESGEGWVDDRALDAEGDPIGDMKQQFFEADIIPTRESPRKDNLKFTSMIGDALLSGPKRSAPAWKLVAMQGEISASAREDIINDIKIPQIDIQLNYTKKVVDQDLDLDPNSIFDLSDTIGPFQDGKMIQLVRNEPLIYLDEVNTELLNENFEIEVFEIIKNYEETSGVQQEVTSSFKRKLFEKHAPQIVDGFMVSPAPQSNTLATLTTSSVEYYFDILKDHEINKTLACRGAEEYNRSSYYIDLDFDCEETSDNIVYTDIYGVVTEPEICQD